MAPSLTIALLEEFAKAGGSAHMYVVVKFTFPILLAFLSSISRSWCIGSKVWTSSVYGMVRVAPSQSLVTVSSSSASSLSLPSYSISDAISSKKKVSFHSGSLPASFLTEVCSILPSYLKRKNGSYFPKVSESLLKDAFWINSSILQLLFGSYAIFFCQTYNIKINLKY